VAVRPRRVFVKLTKSKNKKRMKNEVIGETLKQSVILDLRMSEVQINVGWSEKASPLVPPHGF
jgi:hypothetical protein